MEKFTKQKKSKPKPKSKDKLLYDAESMEIVSYKGWNFVKEPDSVCIVPLVVEENKMYLRMEVIPPYQLKDDQDFHLTCISGTIEEGESPEKCVIRELEEEAGMVLKDNVKIEFFDVLYKSKSQSSRFHLSILPLNIYDFDEVVAKGDGSDTEKLSRTVEVDMKNINRLFPSDIVTKLLLEEVKKYMNI